MACSQQGKRKAFTANLLQIAHRSLMGISSWESELQMCQYHMIVMPLKRLKIPDELRLSGSQGSRCHLMSRSRISPLRVEKVWWKGYLIVKEGLLSRRDKYEDDNAVHVKLTEYVGVNVRSLKISVGKFRVKNLAGWRT